MMCIGNAVGGGMIDLDELYQAVPIGEENAETAGQIWKRLGVWSAGGIRPHLNSLVASGRIVRVAKPRPDGGVVYFFYRRAEE
jgi:predicted ArsR family transcriptional regulator